MQQFGAGNRNTNNLASARSVLNNVFPGAHFNVVCDRTDGCANTLVVGSTNRDKRLPLTAKAKHIELCDLLGMRQVVSGSWDHDSHTGIPDCVKSGDFRYFSTRSCVTRAARAAGRLASRASCFNSACSSLIFSFSAPASILAS